MRNIILTTVSEPKKDCNGSPVFLTDETIEYIITERTDLITEHTNIDCLRTNIDPCVYNTLQNIIRSRDANRGEKNSEH